MSDLAGLLGLGARSGGILAGVDRVREALQENRLHCVVVASDASGRVEDKVVRLARARGVPLVDGPEASELGATVGKPPVMVVGVQERSLASGIVRWASRRGLREE